MSSATINFGILKQFPVLCNSLLSFAFLDCLLLSFAILDCPLPFLDVLHGVVRVSRSANSDTLLSAGG